MSGIFKVSLVLMAAFIESTIFFFPLTATLLALLVVFEKIPKGGVGDIFVLSFLGGLGIDLLQVRPLGTTSALFLLIVFLISLYKKKVRSKNPLFIGLAVFLFAFSSSHLVFGQFEISFIQALVLTSLTLVFLLFFKPLNLRQDEVDW